MKPDNKSKPWQDPEKLRELYIDKRMSQREISDHFDNEITPGGIGYCLDKYDIEKRSRAESAKARWAKTPLNMHTHDPNGYEYVADRSDGRDNVLIHRLLAVYKYGFDAVADMDVHHKNGIPWDNRLENIELLTRSEHVQLHQQEGVIGHN